MKYCIPASFFLAIFLLLSVSCEEKGQGQEEELTGPLFIDDPYLRISAGADDPLYTTYAAAMERSRLYGDKAYKMDYYSECDPLNYSGDQTGRFYLTWMIDKLVIDKMGKFHKKPVVRASFPDMAILEYQPFHGISVQECFFVHSSSIALVQVHIKNRSLKNHSVELFPVMEIPNDSLEIVRFDTENQAYITHHYETKERLISDLYRNAPYPTHVRDVFTASEPAYSYGGFNGGQDGFYNYIKTDFYEENRSQDSLNFREDGFVDFIALHYKFDLQPGEEKTFRYFRGWQDRSESVDSLMAMIRKLRREDIQPFINTNVALFRSIPRIEFSTEAEKLVYLGAFNLARACMLPPSGKTSHNFYVFSRQPLWGWGHGHQVLHESLSMLAYAYLDPVSAMGSQRVYMEQQSDNGLIAYRHGPRGMQDYPHKGEPTTSAPFYSWINLEVYKVSNDRTFLEEAYASGKKYTEWLVRHRDKDGDGTFEWGPYGIIENVRDWYNVIFQVSAERYLDVDKEDISDELECLDLTLMVINEMHCLADMAVELGLPGEANIWNAKADTIIRKVNELMWDEETGFYYHVNMEDHSFQFMGRDLRRKEIIGFLALWAEAAPPESAERLIASLTDTSEFWRTYGVPTLSAADEWYSPYVDYCCKWNGPVWLLWDYMVFDGLVKYGYHELAEQVAEKMLLAVTTQLSKNHNYWESYSPDNTALDCPPNYIWDAIMAKLLIDLEEIRQ